MPLLSKEQQKTYLGPVPNLRCNECHEYLIRNYCRECDEFFFDQCKCNEPTGHEGHRDYSDFTSQFREKSGDSTKSDGNSKKGVDSRRNRIHSLPGRSVSD